MQSEPANVKEFLQAVMDEGKRVNPAAWIRARAHGLAFELLPHLQRVMTPDSELRLPSTADGFRVLTAVDLLSQAAVESPRSKSSNADTIVFGRLAEMLHEGLGHLRNVDRRDESFAELIYEVEDLERFASDCEDRAWAGIQ